MGILSRMFQLFTFTIIFLFMAPIIVVEGETKTFLVETKNITEKIETKNITEKKENVDYSLPSSQRRGMSGGFGRHGGNHPRHGAPCIVDGKKYKHGRWMPANDGCNQCKCYNGQKSMCSEQFCSDPSLENSVRPVRDIVNFAVQELEKKSRPCKRKVIKMENFTSKKLEGTLYEFDLVMAHRRSRGCVTTSSKCEKCHMVVHDTVWWNKEILLLDKMNCEGSPPSIRVGTCACNGYISSKGQGECRTRYKGRYWCYVNSSAKCRKFRSSSGRRFYSFEACRIWASHQTQPDGFLKLMGKTLDQAKKFLKENQICAGYNPQEAYRITRIVDQSYKNEDRDVNRLHVTTENHKIVKIHATEYVCDEIEMRD